MPWKPKTRTKPRPREPHTKSTTERGYGWDWQQFRAYQLSLEPLCQDCLEQGMVTPATELHHKTKIKHAPHLRLDPDNVRPLCGPCHDRRTAGGE